MIDFLSKLHKPGRLFIFLVLISLFLRIVGFSHDFLDVDESQFATFAHVLMDGGLPYLDSLDTKPPLIYYFYAFCFFIFGKYSMSGVHFIHILWLCIGALYLFKIARDYLHSESPQFAALFFILILTCGLPKIIATSIASVMIVPLIISAYYFIKAGKEISIRADLLAGFFAGVAFLFKYQGGMQIAIMGATLLCFVILKLETFKTSLLRLTLNILGFFVPLALFVFYLKTNNIFDDFWVWSIEGSQHYIESGNQIIDYGKNFSLRTALFGLGAMGLFYYSFLFLTKKISDLFKVETHLFIVIWFLLSWVPVIVGGRFYGHYYLQLIPSLAILATLGLAHLSLKQLGLTFKLLILTPVILSWLLRADLHLFYYVFPDDSLFEQEKIGLWLKENTQEKDSLFVWGFATAIYFHAERKPTSRFLWTDLLTGKIPGSNLTTQESFDTSQYARPIAWEMFWEDMKKNPPRYFVDTSTANIHHYQKYPLIKYPKLHEFIKHHYRFKSIVEKAVIYQRK